MASTILIDLSHEFKKTFPKGFTFSISQVSLSRSDRITMVLIFSIGLERYLLTAENFDSLDFQSLTLGKDNKNCSFENISYYEVKGKNKELEKGTDLDFTLDKIIRKFIMPQAVRFITDLEEEYV